MNSLDIDAFYQLIEKYAGRIYLVFGFSSGVYNDWSTVKPMVMATAEHARANHSDKPLWLFLHPEHQAPAKTHNVCSIIRGLCASAPGRSCVLVGPRQKASQPIAHYKFDVAQLEDASNGSEGRLPDKLQQVLFGPRLLSNITGAFIFGCDGRALETAQLALASGIPIKSFPARAKVTDVAVHHSSGSSHSWSFSPSHEWQAAITACTTAVSPLQVPATMAVDRPFDSTDDSKGVTCLTMHQPWASLVAYGIKRVEGRVWGAKFRYATHLPQPWSGA